MVELVAVAARCDVAPVKLFLKGGMTSDADMSDALRFVMTGDADTVTSQQ